MHFSTLITAVMATGAASHVIRAPAVRNWCGTPHPTDNQLVKTKNLAEKEAVARLEGEMTIAEAIVVDTYFHIVTSTTSEEDGYLSVRSPAPLHFPRLRL